jgi:hypothetical protein
MNRLLIVGAILAAAASCAISTAPSMGKGHTRGWVRCRVPPRLPEPSGAGGYIQVLRVRYASCGVGRRVVSSPACGRTRLSGENEVIKVTCRIAGYRWICTGRVVSEFEVDGRCEARGHRVVTWTGGGE